MIKKLFLILTASIFFSGSAGILSAQGISSAVMNVTVEVVSGSSFSRNDTTNVFRLSADNNEVQYAEFSLVVPDGVQILTSSSGSVLMTSGAVSWMMGTDMEKNLSEEKGLLNFRFSTNALTREVDSGLYKGVQVTTIEYL